MAFTRKNLLEVKVRLLSPHCAPLVTQPSAVVVRLAFRDTAKQPATTSIDLSFDGECWTALWDTSVVGEGRVEWLVYSEGSAVAAQEGFFNIIANKANVV